MVKKFYKKAGFTLIELLVVIAIIAVLVAVVVPSVSSSVIKASAAADAANLRSIAEEAAIIYLAGKETNDGIIHFSPPDEFLVVEGPIAKTKGVKGKSIQIALDPSTLKIIAKYGDKDIDYFSKIAETGVIPSA